MATKNDSYESMPGKYPAVVAGYDVGSRTCRVKIPGVTDGADAFPSAEIEYPIGDKSSTTEIEILPGDMVWVSFIGGDPRHPLITGWRNPKVGNSSGLRKWHHANVEINGDGSITIIAGNVTIQAQSVTIDSPEAECTGALTVNGLLTFKGGMTGSGGAGGAAATIDGNVAVTGTVMDSAGNSNHHSH